MRSIYTLDLNFLNRKDAIAAYLIPYSGGAVLVETGSGSTINELTNNLYQHGLKPKDVTHVLLTHIHLDHAGAAGWLAKQGAQIFVHPVGEHHMKYPEKLISSAKRIYGDKMDLLWGEFLPVPAEKLTSVGDRDQIKVGNLVFTAIHTPGHAEHHISWLLEDTCFTGDVGGIRIPGVFYIRLPLVPPELNFEKWRHSLALLSDIGFKNIVPTHFGIFNDAEAHLTSARQILDENERWMEQALIDVTPIEELRDQYVTFLHKQGLSLGVSEDTLQISEIANPSRMAADGIQRYWNKYRSLNKM
jgi:glyoxylase-like metal-dependent hydrolase (beta-lactamase superfamily II)